ncbi:hypothetical protein MHB50_10905 [Siminovitchia sp. FSL H7-0308]|uniref:YkvI family membrane protein n=1 Tax=unclassified Siminovitchia TaxID=2837530 RepID=UPI00097D0D79|nr:hypothetical protein BLX87_00365 [Bacillus sp. VT-16-64]
MKNWIDVCQVAAVYVGTVIGAGFATGREIVEFFTRFGFLGLLSILMAGFLFVILGSKIMLLSIDIKATSFEQLNEYLFGKKLAKFINLFLLVMLVGVCGVMLAGAEALFVEQLNFPKFSGMLLTTFIGLVIMAAGIKGLLAINVIVVPMMIAFNTAVLFHIVPGGNVTLWFQVEDAGNGWFAVLSAISYAGFNLALAQAVLVPLAAEINDRKTVKWGGVMGGVFLTVLLISSHICLSVLRDPRMFEIPMAVIVHESAGSLYLIYILIIYGEIFTTLIGNTYGIERQLHQYVPTNPLWIILFLFIVFCLISLVKYGKLLGLLYPLFGYVSIGFLLLLLIKPAKVSP